MSSFLESVGLPDLLSIEQLIALAKAVATLVIGWFLARGVSAGLGAILARRKNRHLGAVAQKLGFYALIVLVVLLSLTQLGVNLGVLLGAAGILSVAIGFASQTSVSNLISGLFLVAERPFQIGDQLVVDGNLGEVLSIDLLSVKVRMFDNVMMRVPNAYLINTVFFNRTRFPIRRVDLKIGVAYKESTEKVREILFDVASRNPFCLDEPEPLFIYLGYGDSALELQFSVWALRENFRRLRTSIREEIKAAFDENEIEIPFPHRSLYAGTATDPFPIRIVGDEDEGGEGTPEG